MKFLIDENLPPRLARWLIEQGHDAVHVDMLGLAGRHDREIEACAIQDGRVVLTQDNDFDSAATPLRVVRIGLGNASTALLIAWFGERLPQLLARLQAGERIIVLR